MKDVDTVIAESCIKAEKWEEEHNRPFDRGSFFIGYAHAIHDIIEGKLPQVVLEYSKENLKKLIARSKEKAS